MLSGDILHIPLGLSLGRCIGVVGQAREAASRAKWQTVVVRPGTIILLKCIVGLVVLERMIALMVNYL